MTYNEYYDDMRQDALDKISIMVKCAGDVIDFRESDFMKEYYTNRINGALSALKYVGLISAEEEKGVQNKVCAMFGKGVKGNEAKKDSDINHTV